MIRRRTTCIVPGHGTRCEVARERDGRYPRTTEKRMAYEYEDMEEDDQDWEEHPTFVSCTCEHDSEQHGWGECNVEGCPCEGGWEE